MELAGRLRVEDPNRLRDGLVRVASGRRHEVEVAPRRPEPSGANPRELEALRLLIHHRDDIVTHLDARLFADPTARRAYEALAAHPAVPDAAADADPPVQELLFRLAQEEAGEGPTAADEVALLVKEALSRLRAEARRGDDLVRAHEINRLADRIQVPDTDLAAVAEGLELLRAHGRGSHDGAQHAERADHG